MLVKKINQTKPNQTKMFLLMKMEKNYQQKESKATKIKKIYIICLLLKFNFQSFFYYISEKTCILQRTQYVTSAYKNKVSQAVGFRNLFAERPFLCKNLFEEEDEEIVSCSLFLFV